MIALPYERIFMTQQTNGAFGPFSDTINFIIELDKLKRVYRKNNV